MGTDRPKDVQTKMPIPDGWKEDFFRSLLFEIWSIFWFNYLLCCTVLLIRCEITSIRGAAVSKYETKTDFSDSNNLLKGPIELCVPPSLYLNLPPFFQRLLSRPSFLGMNCKWFCESEFSESWFLRLDSESYTSAWLFDSEIESFQTIYKESESEMSLIDWE